jgi:osmotically-inducible protein OsmY
MSSTEDILKAVEAELDFDPLVDPAGITVKNLNGEVALNGTVPNYPQYREAAAAAQRVGGVNWDVTVPLGVEATARDGNLTLAGTVHFGSERTAAETAVSGLTGVRNVKDEIAISFDAGPGDVTLMVQTRWTATR